MSEKNCDNKIAYHFLRNSAERLASDLKSFADEIAEFSDEQLYALSANCDLIRQQSEAVKAELAKRFDNKH